MAIKPVLSDVQDVYDKVSSTAYDDKVTQGIDWGWNLVLGKLARCYDVSGWAADCPPAVFDMVLRLAYAYASGEAVHTGGTLNASDDLATRIVEQVLERVKELCPIDDVLLDSSGDIITGRTTTASNRIRLRTTDRIFTPGKPSTWTATEPATGSEWS